MIRRTAARVSIAAAALITLAACSTPVVVAGSPAAVPAPPPVAQGSLDVPQVVEPQPPTLVRTQGRVEIFEGEPEVEVELAEPGVGNPAVTIEVIEDGGEVGTHVADGAGRTLYRFDEDTADPSKATCAGACAKTWPPLLVKGGGDIYARDLDGEQVGYVERADGTCQVTVGGQPVYYYAEDEKPGDARGQGIGDTWYVVGPDGGRSTGPDAPSASTGY